MTKTQSTIEIAASLKKYLYGNCSEEENAVVEKWLKNPANKKFFDEFRKKPASEIINSNNIDPGKARLALQQELNYRRKITIKRRLWLAAASVILIAGLSTAYLSLNQEEVISKTSYVKAFKIFTPGDSKAILSKSDGEKVVIEKENPLEQIDEVGGVKLELKGDTLSYEKLPVIGDATIYNEIEVPRNGEFSLKLNDGTIVWLNSESKLRYPVTFNGNTREVYLEGEAYFKVRHNAQKKFIVHTDKARLEVKGTSFNINAYKDEVNVATLVEGSIDVRHKYDENSTVNLKPGQQARVISVNHKIRVKDVETLYYTSWKDGYFAYKESSLNNILNQLSRWYDFEFEYHDEEAKDELFTARLKRYDNVGEIFYILEQTGKVRFKNDNNRVIVIAKN